MDRELELATAATLAGAATRRRRRAGPAAAACMNCGTALKGPYCHACGQLAENYHRSIGHLVAEAVEDFFHLDGRLWKTLPRLVLRPGRLTRDYLDGHRAAQVPPLRLFLVVLLLVFLFGGLGSHNGRDAVVFKSNGRPVATDDAGRERLARAAANEVTLDLGAPAASKAATDWIRVRMVKAMTHPDQFTAAMDSWAHRLAVVLLPIGAGFLSLLFVFQRRFFVYDHLIFTMHSLSFLGLLLSLVFLTKLEVPALAGLPLLAAPIHLFVHMRGVYATSILGTLFRMALLFVGSFFAFGILMLALVLLGLNAMAA